jgi:hypothetical protein
MVTDRKHLVAAPTTGTLEAYSFRTLWPLSGAASSAVERQPRVFLIVHGCKLLHAAARLKERWRHLTPRIHAIIELEMVASNHGAYADWVAAHPRITGPMQPALYAKACLSKPCMSPAVSGKISCRMHNALKHGRYKREAIDEHRQLRNFLRYPATFRSLCL